LTMGISAVASCFFFCPLAGKGQPTSLTSMHIWPSLRAFNSCRHSSLSERVLSLRYIKSSREEPPKPPPGTSSLLFSAQLSSLSSQHIPSPSLTLSCPAHSSACVRGTASQPPVSNRHRKAPKPSVVSGRW
jgi:hypothetical protein